MRKLKTEFNKSGYSYKLIYRNKVYAIYEQKDESSNICYEVVKVRQYNKACNEKNINIGDEFYPPPRDWGLYGFTYRDLKDAEFAYDYLNNIPDTHDKNIPMSENIRIHKINSKVLLSDSKRL